MADITEAEVTAASEKLLAAKKSRGTAKTGAKVDAYQAAADELAKTRSAFRAQEESAGRRTGFVSGDAAQGGN